MPGGCINFNVILPLVILIVSFASIGTFICPSNVTLAFVWDLSDSLISITLFIPITIGLLLNRWGQIGTITSASIEGCKIGPPH